MAKADDELCPKCAKDLSRADISGVRLHVLTCTDTPPPGWNGQKWLKDMSIRRKRKH